MPRLRTRLHVAFGLTMLASLCACDSAPKGQVLASVDGDEITLAELELEQSFVSFPPGLTNDEREKLVLQKIVERKLWAKAASDRGLDRESGFYLLYARAREVILANALAKRISGDVDEPSESDIARTISDNPWAFDDRKKIDLNQLLIATKDISKIKDLAVKRSLEEVEKYAALNRLAFSRRDIEFDSINFNRSDAEKYRNAIAGSIIVQRDQERIIFSEVRDVRLTPTPTDDRPGVARRLYRSRAVAAALADFTTTLRKNSEVRFAADLKMPSEQ